MISTIKPESVRLAETAAQNGTLRGIALAVYTIICATPGLTGGEIFRKYADNNPNTSRARNEIAKRISDLVGMGLVNAIGETICPESGRKANRWAASGVAPTKDLKLKFRAFVPAPRNLLPGTSLAQAHLKSPEKAKQVAYDSRNAAQARSNAAYSDKLQVELDMTKKQLDAATLKLTWAQKAEELANVKLQEAGLRLREARAKIPPEGTIQVSVNDDPAFETYFLATAKAKGLTHEALIKQCVRTYQAFDSGLLVEAGKRAEEQKSPVFVQSKRHLERMVSRTKFLLKFKRFMTKRLVKQAEDTLSALEVAISAL
jgi:hypothetical protein